MQSLTTSSFNLSKIPKSLPLPNGFTLLPIFPQLPTSSLPHLTHKTTSKSKRFSTTLSRDPSPVLEDSDIGEESEKFDWYSQWYPVAPICDLDKRVPHAKRVMGIDIVVRWDRKEEKWQVFDDSCPHRLAPLSEGRIDQWGRLQCVYHGWCFDGAGDCNFIPQAPPDGPPVHTFKKACAASYPSIEQNKIVWFWPKSEPQYKNIAMKRKPPYIPELDDPSYSSLMGQRDIPYGYEILIENLMDPSHVPYAHYGIMRVPNAKKRPKADREGGRPMEISVQTLDINGFFAKQESGNSKFIPPCIFYAFGGISGNNGSVSLVNPKEEPPRDVGRRILLVFICIPVSPGKSRLIWCFPRNFGVWIDRLFPRWIFHIGQNLILDSDLYLLHLEERKILAVGSENWQKACFVPTKADALVVGFRKWLRKYSNNQIDWRSKFSTMLPPSPPKEQLMDRYWSHVVQCSSCRTAMKGLRALEVVLQVISLASIGVVAAVKQNVISAAARTTVVSMAVLCFAASRWLSHFIYKNFYFHDYNHALR